MRRGGAGRVFLTSILRPSVVSRPRNLWNYQINSFILTPSIVAAIESIPAPQQRHKERLPGFQFARGMWRRLMRAAVPRPATAQEQMDSMVADESAFSGSGTGLYSACQLIKRKEAYKKKSFKPSSRRSK